MHTLIVGAQGVGKSTLIRRVLAEIGLPLWGFATVKENALAEPELGSPVYIYDAAGERARGIENLVGYCKNQRPVTYPEAFERFAKKLSAPAPANSIVLLDELGSMENAAPAFRAAVLGILDGNRPAIAAVKDKDTPFLNAVREHPNCRCFHITRENRDALFPEVLGFVKAQIK